MYYLKITLTILLWTGIALILACSSSNQIDENKDSGTNFDPGADSGIDSNTDSTSDSDSGDSSLDTGTSSVADSESETDSEPENIVEEDINSGFDTDTEIENVEWINATCNEVAGALNFETAQFCVALDPVSQTIRALVPKSDQNFDFTPSDRLTERRGNGFFHLGDITLRYKNQGESNWQDRSSAHGQGQAITLPATDEILASAALDSILGGDKIKVTRNWQTQEGKLKLNFIITNSSDAPLEIGALGIPMIFNNIISNRNLNQAHRVCSFSDPYIGNDAGYIQVTRLNGSGPSMLILPDKNTPLEAYNPIMNPPLDNSLDPPSVFYDNTPRNNTFEGFFEWMVHSVAYAQDQWQGVSQWNTPTSDVLAPGQSKTIGLQFVLVDEIRNIEPTLLANKRPVAVGVPGFILPNDLEGSLFLKYPHSISSMEIHPAGSLEIIASETTNGWRNLKVSTLTTGRSRLTVTYSDGTDQSIHYYGTLPAQETIDNMGEFLTTRAWYENNDDYFNRSPSVMTYDMEEDDIVTQSKQSWVCGLGDDGGATWLAGIMKLLGRPNADQIKKYERFVDGPIFGNLQYDSGNRMYGIKRTLFYYEPSLLPPGYYDASIDWNYWGAWSRTHIEHTPRSYNYPHVAALYWTLYRLARNYEGLVTHHSFDWYLNQAFETSMAMTTIGNGYSQFGLMNGSIFLEILKDLYREEQDSKAMQLEAAMKERADLWNSQAYPFGSEMPWDSTGQEEVYQWTRYFGYDSKAAVCLDAILGYMPSIPHWGYNGCARRYWDFKYGGSKIDRLERMLHHYGSSLNAIPVLIEYRDNPEDLHLLKIGYAGMMGTLSAIGENGFPSMAFHSFPDIMDWDARTGDVGLSVFGHTYNSGTYVVDHPDFGPLAYGGNLRKEGNVITVIPKDSFRQRLYLAPVGLWLTLDAGEFEAVSLNLETNQVTLTLAPSTSFCSSARLRIEQPAIIPGVGDYHLTGYSVQRGAHVIPLGHESTILEF